MSDDIDDLNYNDTNCGPSMAGYITPDEREIKRLTKHIESLTTERDELKKRVKELESSWRCFRCGELFTDRDKAAEHFNGDFCEDEEPWCEFVKRMEKAEFQLQAARELANLVNSTGPRIAQVFDGWHNDGTAWTEWDESVRREVAELQVKAREFLEGRKP